MKTMVVDASFAVSWMLPDESSKRADGYLADILSGNLVMAVTDLWHVEMINVMLVAIKRKRIDEEKAGEALTLLDKLPLQTFDHQNVLWKKRMIMIARRFGLSAYDAAYVELADRLQCPLLTNDRDVQAAAEELGIPLS